MRTLNIVALLVISALACGGCAEPVDLGPTGTISGNLTYNGKPLAEGTQVVFMQRQRGFAGLGATDAEGNFTITLYRKSTGATSEMPVGTYIVMVQPPSDPNAEMELADPSDVATPNEMSSANQKQLFVKTEFPMKYRQPSTSGITREVKEGPNTFEIDLK